MRDCLFCKLASGEIYSKKLYEDEKVFVVLDINPYVLGHCLVIPKEHAKYVWEISDYSFFMESVKKFAKILQKVFDTELVQGGISGVDIAHAHFHLFPRDFSDVKKDFPKERLKPKPSEKEMDEVFNNIKKIIDKEI